MGLDYKIVGNDMQMLVVRLKENEVVIAEAGAMNYMEDGIDFKVSLGDGSEGSSGAFSKIFKAGKRLMAGESFFLTHFINTTAETKEIAFSAPFPGQIVAVNLSDFASNSILCQRDAFLCAEYGVSVGVAFTKKFSTGFFGGEGFILEKLSGSGTVFIHACGTILEKELEDEEVTVDAGSIVAFEDSIDYSIKPVGGMKSMMFGGEGLFFATLRGSGAVYLQSLPFSRLAGRILKAVPKGED